MVLFCHSIVAKLHPIYMLRSAMATLSQVVLLILNKILGFFLGTDTGNGGCRSGIGIVSGIWFLLDYFK
jgi:hypothetical protein